MNSGFVSLAALKYSWWAWIGIAETVRLAMTSDLTHSNILNMMILPLQSLFKSYGVAC